MLTETRANYNLEQVLAENEGNKVPLVKVIFGLADGVERRGKYDSYIEVPPREDIRYKQSLYLADLFSYPSSEHAYAQSSKWRMKHEVSTKWDHKNKQGELKINDFTIPLRVVHSMDDLKAHAEKLGLQPADCLVITPTDINFDPEANSSVRAHIGVSHEGHHHVRLGKLKKMYSSVHNENLHDIWHMLVNHTHFFHKQDAQDGSRNMHFNASMDNLTGNNLDGFQIEVPLGHPHLKTDVQTTEGPFQYVPEYKTEYPQVVIEALGTLYSEYNKAFAPLVRANREFETDYQYCFTADGIPLNRWIQIDMSGLTKDFLDAAKNYPVEKVTELLKGKIFEIENSLAMYQLLEQLFSTKEKPSQFKKTFRASLDTLRQQYPEKKIALLAVTDEKYQDMRRSEFGKEEDEILTDKEVRELSGFDKLFGPDEFQAYIEACKRKGTEPEYLLYVRSSDPKSKLKDPTVQVSVPLLEDPQTRRFIKAYTITFNVDNPLWPLGSPRKINDTKAYQLQMGMGLEFYSQKEFDTEQILAQTGIQVVRAKPMQSSYGCYGHERGSVDDSAFWSRVERHVSERGPYIIQPEIPVPTMRDVYTGQTYNYIDRNFMTFVSGTPVFMGGFRSLMPTDTTEARRGRIHGNENTVWAEIH